MAAKIGAQNTSSVIDDDSDDELSKQGTTIETKAAANEGDSDSPEKKKAKKLKTPFKTSD